MLVALRAGHFLAVNLAASRAAQLLKLGVEGLAVGADAGIAERAVLRVSELSPNLGDGLRDQAAAVWD